MPVSVTMPRLGESVTEGTVTRWLKAEGDHVKEDEPLLEVSTDKVDTEIPSPASGVLLSIKVAEDETVEIGTEIAIIGDAGDSADSAPAPTAATAPEAAPIEATPAPAAPTAPVSPAVVPPTLTAPPNFEVEASPVATAPAPIPPTPIPPFSAPSSTAPFVPPSVPLPFTAAPAAPSASGLAAAPAVPALAPATGTADRSTEEDSGTYLTPLVRKLAAEHGIDAATLQGTGVGGRIRKSDVLAAAERAQTAQATATPTYATSAMPSNRGRVQKMSRRRTIIAARMVESMQTMAQLTTVVEVDVTKIARLRAQAKADFLAREGVSLSFLPFFTIATVEALKVHPIMNSSIDTEEETITFHDSENIGVAVDTDAGLTVPVIQHAGDLNLAGVARKIADLAERTRANKISPDELVGATFTITNTGSRGSLIDTPIINQPQVAILGTGTVTKRTVVLEDPEQGDTIAIRSMVYLALSYDHRIIDGADAARFLGTIKGRLEAGSFEGDLGLA